MYMYSPLAIWRNWSSFLSVFDKDLHQFESYYGLSVLALGGYIYILEQLEETWRLVICTIVI